MSNEYQFITHFQPVIKNIRNIAKNYLVQSSRKSVVLGVSGGLDSALCAALVRPVCDEIGIPLIGVSLPSTTNRHLEVVRAGLVGGAFCTKFAEIPIDEMYKTVQSKMFELHQEIPGSEEVYGEETEQEVNIRNGNIKARLRMINLFNIAQQHKGIVLSTDNYTELMLGFWTLHGDVGSFGMIQNLWKSEAYDMAQFLCNTELVSTPLHAESLQACIDCHATDGLGVSKSDLDQILPDWNKRHKTTRSGYNEVDDILYDYLYDGGALLTETQQGVIDRMKRTEFKRNDPYNIKREDLIQQ